MHARSHGIPHTHTLLKALPEGTRAHLAELGGQAGSLHGQAALQRGTARSARKASSSVAQHISTSAAESVHSKSSLLPDVYKLLT